MFYIFTLQQDIDRSGFFKRQQMKKKMRITEIMSIQYNCLVVIA